MNWKSDLSYIINSIFPKISKINLEEYIRYKFYKNNKRILILSLFLLVEQFLYGLFLSEHGSDRQKVYFLTTCLMFFYFVLSSFILLSKKKRINIVYKIYEPSLAFLGMLTALLRFIFLERNAAALPTVYIAALYGLAVIFYLPYLQSFLIYFILSFLACFFIINFNIQIESKRVIADIGSNGLMAWIISIINYRNFVNDFFNKKLIEKNNEILIEKNNEIEIKNQELKEQSLRDELTGLFNRRKLDYVMKEVFVKAGRYNSNFAVIIMDIDYFKKINDTYGHDIGDIVLKEVSGILMDNIREVDICGRWGGEEFLIICQETDLYHAYLLAERLRRFIEDYLFHGKYSISASFGVASYFKDIDLKELLKTADVRLYEAKESGRNRVIAGLLNKDSENSLN